MTTKYPKIFLAIDNCFASKRWTEPLEWMSFAKDIGIKYVEASADNECDPLYSTNTYLDHWKGAIGEAGAKTGVKVCNLYSGHGTYSTLGLGHTDQSVRGHIKNKWLKKMIDMATGIDAGLGFFTHAFNQSTLTDRSKYTQALETLTDAFSELSVYAKEKGIKSIGVEQMYTPHQVPWTMNGAESLLRNVYSKTGDNFYITIDVGHQSGQRKFLRPKSSAIKSYLEKIRVGETAKGIWLGSENAYSIFYEAILANNTNTDEFVDAIQNDINKNEHLFAHDEDGDPYLWLERLGRWSPIIHLQQTDGKSSAHRPFTKEWNEKGIIKGERVLEALKKSFDKGANENMPVPCKEIYLTIEVFSATADIPFDIKSRLTETVNYWRDFIPEDGIELDKLIAY